MFTNKSVPLNAVILPNPCIVFEIVISLGVYISV